MAIINPNKLNQGAFVPTTNVWDVGPIYETDVNSEEFKELLVRLYQNLNLIAVNLNIRAIGTYDLQEILNGKQYFKDPALSSSTAQTPQLRPVFSKVIYFSPLPNAGTLGIPHNIPVDNNYMFTLIVGTATDPINLSYLPLPYSSGTLNKNIGVAVNATEVLITTYIDYSAYTKCQVVLEYIKQ